MMNMRARQALPLVLGLVLGSGCVHNAFTPATTMKLSARPEGCYLDMIFHGVPPFSYVVIGRVTTDSTAPGLWALGENNEVAMERLQEEACRVGAHGLLQVGAQSEGVWNGNGYSKSTTGAAVAFVYVDPYGRPLPPPTGPKLLIHPGGYAASPPPPAPPPPLSPPPPPALPSPGAPGASPENAPPAELSAPR
jgi:hypothetical protein